ncbi:MAG TPA: hypothetical protein VFM70_02390 [Salinimicrobium sp.]|nr:hypothetical protein [Salinimicrobium sp.]
MGRIEDERLKRKDRSANEPLNKFGKTDTKRNEFDIDKKTIKDQQNKK